MLSCPYCSLSWRVFSFFVHPTQPELRLLDAFDRLMSPSIPSVKRFLGDSCWWSLLLIPEKNQAYHTTRAAHMLKKQPTDLPPTQPGTKHPGIYWTKWPTWRIHLLMQPLILAGSFHGGFPMVFCWHRDAKKAALPNTWWLYGSHTFFLGGYSNQTSDDFKL